MRISIMGVSGAGKSTLAAGLAARFGLERVELDALNWLPGWRDLHAEDPQAFVDRVEAATRGEKWVTDGNYSICQDLIWSRATDVIWLDYPLSVSMPRLLRRTLNRAVTGRELWAGTVCGPEMGRPTPSPGQVAPGGRSPAGADGGRGAGMKKPGGPEGRPGDSCGGVAKVIP